MSVTGGIMAGIGLAGSIGGAAIESSGANSAASTQANAADYNAQLQAELGQEQLGYESTQYGNSLNLEAPWLQEGANSLDTLQYLMGLGPNNPNGTESLASGVNGPTGAMGATNNSPQNAGLSTGSTALSIPGVNGSVSVPTVNSLTGTADTNLGAYGSLMSQYPGGQFTAPTAAQAAATPGYQFALQQGEGAAQASAAANGSLLTGGTQTALDQYAQNYANTNYNNVYNQALQTYNTNYNTWANQKAQTYNMLAGQSGTGQITAQQLSNAGLTSANQVGSTLGSTGNAISQQNSNAAAATASGYVGTANAYGGALGSMGSNLNQYLLLQQLMGQNGGGTTALSPGTVSNPSIANYLNNNGPEPGYTDWSQVGGAAL